MHDHAPNGLGGPNLGSEAWWRGTRGADADSAAPQVPSTKKKAPIRTDLVERVRREIAAGTYDTAEKWDAALEKLLERLMERD